MRPVHQLISAFALALPAATLAAQTQVAPQAAQMATALRQEIASLHRSMVAAFRSNPASVARFYTDDARIIGVGSQASGRAEVDAYWSRNAGGSDWSLEIIDVGGSRDAPWVLARSRLTGSGGRQMTTNYLAILQRGTDGALRYRIDLYTSAGQGSPVRAAPPATRSPDGITLATPRVTIPLTRAGGFYFADVRVNGRPYRFTLETGASFLAVGNKVARELGFPVDTTQPVNGRMTMRAGMPTVTARIDSLTVGGATFRGLDTRVTALFDGADFDGIISLALLQDLLWTLDLGQSRLLVERDSLPAPNGRDVLPFARRDPAGRIDVMMNLGGEQQAVVFDTRYADWIMTNDSLAAKLRLATPLRSVGTAWGPSVGIFEMRGARLDEALTLGRYALPRPPLVFRNRGGTIAGVRFLEQFAITVDQRRGRVRFTRADSVVNVPTLEWETGGEVRRAVSGAPDATSPARTFGFRMARRPDGRLFVIMLDTTSPAATLGIRENDEVVEVDGVAAAQMNPQIFRAALARGGPVKFVFSRDGRQLEFMVESSAPQPAAQDADVAAIRHLDSLWAQMYARQDTGLALRLYADSLVFTGANGAKKTREEELADVRPQPGLVMEYFRTTPTDIRIEAGSGHVSGVAEWRFQWGGQTREISRRYSTRYAKGGPLGWQIVSVQMRAP
jgi:ketosteroid isomerase-like protein